MADTGAPWNIPYVEPTDLVRDYPAADEAMAEAVAAGLTLAGGLVAVKSAIFTGTQTNSTLSGANFAVTDLSITHETADAANKLIIFTVLGVAGNNGNGDGVGVAVSDGTNLLAIGDAEGNRSRVSSGFHVDGGFSNTMDTTAPSTFFVHTPGAGSKTYTTRAINLSTTTQTVFVNRTRTNVDNAKNPRGISSLIIMEVKV